MNEYLILVDEQDIPCGKMEKLEVHRLGLLHRAFSVFILNSKGELLLQQRADHKYHSAGLWSNTCCSHPREGEGTEAALNRRLQEEMGLSCKTAFAFTFMYKTHFDNGLIENELDHVYIGISDTQPVPEPSEVKNWKYISLGELEMDLRQNPHNYTAWLSICFAAFKKQCATLSFQTAS
jgi:isopentenyl-diphosphate delta-isomerase